MKLLSISLVMGNCWDLSKPSLCLVKAEAIRSLRNVYFDFVVYLTLILMCNHCLEGAQGHWQITVLWFRTLFPCPSWHTRVLLLLPSALPGCAQTRTCVRRVWGKSVPKGLAPGSVSSGYVSKLTQPVREDYKGKIILPFQTTSFYLLYHIL